MPKLKYAARLFDRKPLACHLYVTDRCNLDCHYCSEYDNSVPHPALEDLNRWSAKARELGCLHMGLQGGEPLLHPEVVEVVRYCKGLGFTVSISTNGFLLNRDLVQRLDAAGLDTLQISVDRMTPTASTKKSLKTIIPKLRCLEGVSFKVQLSGVLFVDTLPESEEVLEFALSKGFSSHFRLVHPDPKQEYLVPVGDRDQLDAFIEQMMGRKATGAKIHSPWAILDYQKETLHGKEREWTCTAGYKYFFVSAQGKFWPCSMYRTDIDFMDVTPEMLRQYYVKKECQKGCGVYCVITASLIHERPFKFLWGELGLGRKARHLEKGLVRRLDFKQQEKSFAV